MNSRIRKKIEATQTVSGLPVPTQCLTSTGKTRKLSILERKIIREQMNARAEEKKKIPAHERLVEEYKLKIQSEINKVERALTSKSEVKVKELTEAKNTDKAIQDFVNEKRIK